MNTKPNLLTIWIATFVVTLTAIFVVLKSVGIVSWSWVWVFSPLWGTYVILLILMSVCLALAVRDSKRKIKERNALSSKEKEE